MVKLNQKINWKPASTGMVGLEMVGNAYWNLFWSFLGYPIPDLESEDKKDVLCVGLLKASKRIVRSIEFET